MLGRYIYLSVRGPALLGLYTYLYEDQRGHAIARCLPLCTVAGGYGPVHCHDPSSTGGKPLSCAGCVLKCLFRKCVVNRPHIFLTSASFLEPCTSVLQTCSKYHFHSPCRQVTFSPLGYPGFGVLFARVKLVAWPLYIYICTRTSLAWSLYISV